MKPERQFEEFIKEKVVKMQEKDSSRAKFLVLESEKSRELLREMIDKLGVDNLQANNYIKYCYDMLMELVRAKMLLDGYNASGFGAHEAEVAYLRIMGFDENTIRFADQMRYFRNRIMYYGTQLDKVYAEKVIEFTKTMYPKLKKMVENG